ncbi:50S ribosomal protein L21, mitochondrial-like [Telopea speciosissima]|uniref:50S ribosomal protein L21, mitochondrial-like n=1 Tax=Telopea speciosissima TaxID=54955 RepID=UPI001CC472CF|nr:50S ribosomal protein L21, mitochondrial-like [Telopea speciosissima]
MANRRCLSNFTRHCQSLLSSNASVHNLRTLPHLRTIAAFEPLSVVPTSQSHDIRDLESIFVIQPGFLRHFSSGRRNSEGSDDEDDEDHDGGEVEEDEDEEEEMGESSDGDGQDRNARVSNCAVSRSYSLEEKEAEAAAIGYKVIGPLDPLERPFKHREEAFAVVQIGSHQFKVSNGDNIYTERLKFCEVNDKLILNRVLMLGSRTQTIIGRPTLPEAIVHAVVEEHALDAKVIIFKKKRRKNYRRTKGHRQELTRLRITDIEGIQKPEKVKVAKPEKVKVGKLEKEILEKPEKEAVAA